MIVQTVHNHGGALPPATTSLDKGLGQVAAPCQAHLKAPRRTNSPGRLAEMSTGVSMP